MNPDRGAPAAVLARSAQGYRTTLLAQAIRVGCKVAGIIVLARLVSPSDHGLFAMASSLMLFLVLFRDVGLGAASLQMGDLSEEQCSTLHWVHVLIGLFLAIVMLVVSSAYAAFFGEPQLVGLLFVISGSFPLIGLSAWPRLLLARELRFTELNRIETTGTIVGTVAMMVAAAIGAGAYSWAVFLLVLEAVCVIGVWRTRRPRPRVSPRWDSLRALWRPGAEVTGHNLLLFFQQQIDTVLMGRWFGAAALGYYNRPNQLLAMPATHISAPFAQVLAAALSRLTPGAPEYVRHIRETANLIAHLTLPLAVVCAVIPAEIVRLILGSDWSNAVPLLRWLSISAAASYLSAPFYPVCLSSGQTKRLMSVSALSLGFTLTGLWLGRGAGPVGLAMGLAGAGILSLALRVAVLTGGTRLSARELVSGWLGPLGLAAAMAIGLMLGQTVTAASDWRIRLAASLLTGIGAGACLVAAWPRLRAELVRVWTHRPWSRSDEPVAASSTSGRQ
jgi:PST family polysaccharide transporter